MIKVCAYYQGTIILLEEFETEEQATEFMSHNYILHYADEYENADEDELIYTDEMFIDTDDIPFSELLKPWERLGIAEEDWDELPF